MRATGKQACRERFSRTFLDRSFRASGGVDCDHSRRGSWYRLPAASALLSSSRLNVVAGDSSDCFFCKVSPIATGANGPLVVLQGGVRICA
mmetsp:Transcript_22082/g.67954  ORF Transcript_22082/g.67954 Transcript_22082/m.67954 type:complete len:91 (-) Transcript_22082:5227-5499(-)